MKGSQLTALNALFHLILVPALITTFGNPTKNEHNKLVFEPFIIFLIFSIANIIIHPTMVFSAFWTIKPKKYTLKQYAFAFIISIIASLFTLQVLKPRVTSNLYVFCLLAIGFSAYAIPLILCAHAQSFNEQYEKHLLVIPSIITLVCTFASCVAGSLDTRVMWKFFPTPAFMD
ncbi:Uncharacterized protein QTN25_006275 [Entamoeba marina]